MGGWEQIQPACDISDVLVGIIDDDGNMVGGANVFSG